MEAALKADYKHIDCAHIYGNEQEIGESLQTCFKNGVVKREDIFVTSKLWYETLICKRERDLTVFAGILSMLEKTFSQLVNSP